MANAMSRWPAGSLVIIAAHRRGHIFIYARKKLHKYLLHCFVRHLQNEIRPERSQQSALHRFNIKSSIADYSYHILIYS